MKSTPEKQSITVLLVEDSPAIAMRIQMYFEKSEHVHFDLEHVLDLQSAFNRLEAGGINVVILDLGLPDSQGIETCIRLAEHSPFMPVVVFTGVDDQELAFEALRLGAQDYLVKGQVDSALLERAINYAIERKRAELTLRDSEEKYRTLLEAMPDITYRIDVGGYFTFVNKAVERIGYTPEELIGKHFSTIIHHEDLAHVSRDSVLKKYKGQFTGDEDAPKLYDERRTGDRKTTDLVLRLISKGIEKVDTLKSSNNTNDSDNPDDSDVLLGLLTSYGEISAAGHYLPDERTQRMKFAGTVGIIKDITERKRAEEEKKELEEQLRQSQKMEAIGRLAGGVAHDMNNVLGAIQGSISVLDLEMDQSDPCREDIENVIVACKKGRDLTRDLLGFARKGKYVKQGINVNKVVNEVIALLRRTISKTIEIKTDLDDNLDFIEGDRSQIHHSLMNVSINATDALHGSGTLFIITRNLVLDNAHNVHRKGLEPGKYIELVVTDDGMGMNSETLQKVFEPFYTTKPKGKGTGLGLSMVYGVIKNHGGSVNITSVEGKGTTVTMTLPVVDGVEVTEEERISIVPAAQGNKGSILLVDDELIIRRSARRLLEKLGYTVYAAENGKEAVHIYKKKKDRLSLVLLDLVMPIMDGPQTFAALRVVDPNVKVLLFSGYSKDHKVEQLLENGALGFIEKPFEFSHLSAAVKKAIKETL